MHAPCCVILQLRRGKPEEGTSGIQTGSIPPAYKIASDLLNHSHEDGGDDNQQNAAQYTDNERAY